MSKPITSRIKRSPLLKYSPLKNDEDEENKIAKGSKTEKGKDKKEIKKVTKKSSYEGEKNVR